MKIKVLKIKNGINRRIEAECHESDGVLIFRCGGECTAVKKSDLESLLKKIKACPENGQALKKEENK